MTADAPAAHHLGHVARGGLLGLAGSGIAAVGAFALALVVTRGFDAETAGSFFATTTLFTLLATACGLGVDAGLARFLLRLEARSAVHDVRRTLRLAIGPAVVVASLLALVGTLVAGPLAGLLGLGAEGDRLLRVVAVALPFAVAADLCLAATRALGRIRTTVGVDRILRTVVQLGTAALVVALGGDPVLLVAGWAAAYLLSAVVAVVLLRRFLATRPTGSPASPEETPDPDLARSFWSFTWPRGVAGLAQASVQKADIVLVAVLLSPAHAALYTAATRFVAVGQMANQAIYQVLQPRFTAILITEDRSTLRTVFGVSTTWGMVLIWPFYLLVACSPVLYLSLFGDSYADATSAVVVVVVMALTMLVSIASGPVDTLLLMAGRSGLSMTNALVAVALDIGLCLLLLPRIGIAGAAIAWAAAVVTRSGLAFWQVRRHVGVSPQPGHLLGVALVPVTCFALPALALSASGSTAVLPWAAVTLASVVAYAVALRALRARLSLDDLVAAVRRRPTPVLPSTSPTSAQELACASER
ncbi:lipopolysaccharide biosynthesis protein [Nocardioides sp.]|uniref:lipopolysaccharide biosynthesis protein n=1 Tax=Nocardioides sp. TaxID=35761 RepID=UPI00286B7DA4|nr:lipopolysaccharide biosynthesis protein [Nocardioides sp.]